MGITFIQLFYRVYIHLNSNATDLMMVDGTVIFKYIFIKAASQEHQVLFMVLKSHSSDLTSLNRYI